MQEEEGMQELEVCKIKILLLLLLLLFIFFSSSSSSSSSLATGRQLLGSVKVLTPGLRLAATVSLAENLSASHGGKIIGLMSACTGETRGREECSR
jgi:hypothetical protein